MTTLLAPPPAVHPSGHTARPPTPRSFLTGCARILLVPLAGLAGLLTGWAVLAPVVGTGWPGAVAPVAGWAVGVAAWLRHRGWPAGTAHLTAWAGPAAVLAPLAPLGWLTPAGLVLWAPVSALLAVALAAAHSPELVRSLPSGAGRAPGWAGCSG
jgi:hypothetical protein